MQSENGHNGDGSGNNQNSPNIIKLPTRKEREKASRVRMKVTLGPLDRGEKYHEPMINLPPFTKILILILFGIHIPMELFLNPEKQYWVIEHFGFIPAYYTGAIAFEWWAIIGPFTFAFLHGGWVHLLINTVMLAAFGAGLERWMGWKRMAILMLSCSLASALVQLAFSVGSDNPVIGASGAISGMFAAAMIMLQQQRGSPFSGRYGLWPFILIWIGISVMFGMMGGPGGESIAWAAHIGGFLAGFALIKPVLRLKV